MRKLLCQCLYGAIGCSLFLFFQAQNGWAQAVGDFTNHTDIGDVQLEGEVDFSDGEYYILSAGNIWGGQDGLHFVYQEITGSFSITGVVESLGSGSKAGFMARSTLDPDSSNYFVHMTGGFQAQPQWRTNQGGPSINFTAQSNTDGKIELVRLGDTFYGYVYNTQGEKVLMHNTNIDMPDSIFVGLAVGSGSPNQYADGFFTEVEITLYDFSTERDIPALSFLPNQPVEDIQISLNVREGSNPDMTVIETPPTGWTVSDIRTTAGTAALDADGNIVWNIPAASGTPVLTYDLLPPEDADSGTWDGTASDGTNTFNIFGDLGLSNANLVRVYFVTSGSLTAPTNTIYKDLLSKGLTMLDDAGDEIFVPGLKYSVAMVDDTNDDPREASDYDIVIAHENVASGNVERYGNMPIPYLNMEQALIAGNADNKPGYMWFGTGGGTPTGYDEMLVLDNTHPITQLYEEFESIPISRNTNPQFSIIPINSIAPGVTPLGELPILGGYLLAVIDKGGTGLRGNVAVPEGYEPTPERRAFLGYHETVHVFNINDDDGIEDISLTREGAILFQRIVQWLLGFEPTADGTEQGTNIEQWSLYE